MLQICDSAFPIGTFNHSYGMETYIREAKIVDAPTLKEWLASFLRTQFTYGEALAIRLCLEALSAGDGGRIAYVDQELTLSFGARETRQAAIVVARHMVGLLLRLWPNPALKRYHEAVVAGTAYGNPAVAFAVAVFPLGLGTAAAISSYGYSVVSTLVQNGVRSIPIGQADGQLIVKSAFPILQQAGEEALELPPSFLGSTVPGLELAQIRHETQNFRLFMS